MPTKRALFISLGVLSVAATLLSARVPEKVDLSPEQLMTTATHVVVGKVAQIWSRREERAMWEYTHYVAEIRVDEVAKGDGLQPGSLVYARYWRKKWHGPGAPPPDTSGHRGLPDSGNRVRVYLARNAYDGFGTTSDGGWNVIGANGFAAP